MEQVTFNFYGKYAGKLHFAFLQWIKEAEGLVHIEGQMREALMLHEINPGKLREIAVAGNNIDIAADD